jgi:hypothetical protein
MNAIGANQSDWDNHFKLMADVNLEGFTGKSYNIIGNNSTKFIGVFDGNGFEISNFTYYSTDQVFYVGIFGAIESGQVRNLGLRNVDVRALGNSAKISALVGNVRRGAIVSNCYVEGGIVSSYSQVGGITGNNFGYPGFGTIRNCYVRDLIIVGDLWIGGLLGSNSGIVINCYSDADIQGISLEGIGGLVGVNGAAGSASISYCYATGSVSGGSKVGGLVGENRKGGVISNCFGMARAPGSNAGGLVGLNCGSINNSFWNIETSGQNVMCSFFVCPSGFGTGCDDGNSKTTAEMKTKSTFTDAGWDFINVWNIGENQTYPYLRVYLPSDINKDGIVNFLDIAITANQWMEGDEVE